MTSLALTSNYSNAFGSTITLDALRRTARLFSPTRPRLRPNTPTASFPPTKSSTLCSMPASRFLPLHRPRVAPVLIRVTQSTCCVFGSRASASAWMKHCRNAWSSIHTAGMRRTRSWLVCIAPSAPTACCAVSATSGLCEFPTARASLRTLSLGRSRSLRNSVASAHRSVRWSRVF